MDAGRSLNGDLGLCLCICISVFSMKTWNIRQFIYTVIVCDMWGCVQCWWLFVYLLCMQCEARHVVLCAGAANCDRQQPIKSPTMTHPTYLHSTWVIFKDYLLFSCSIQMCIHAQGIHKEIMLKAKTTQPKFALLRCDMFFLVFIFYFISGCFKQQCFLDSLNI